MIFSTQVAQSLKYEYHFQDRHQVNPVSTHPEESNAIPPTCHVAGFMFTEMKKQVKFQVNIVKTKKNSWTFLSTVDKICLLMQGRWV